MAQEQEKVLYIYYVITAIGIFWFFNLQGSTASQLYLVSIVLGIGSGFWTIFVTMAAEQFGTNIRATVATTVPNMVRGSLTLVSLLFTQLQISTGDYVKSGWITGVVVLVIGIISVMLVEETYHKDLNYIEGVEDVEGAVA